MVLSRKYNSVSSAIESFDHQDIASGEGIVNYFAAQVQLSGSSVAPFLTSDNGIFSGNIAQKETRNGAITELSDLDYDILFNLPNTINGKVKVSVTIGANWGGNGVATVSLELSLFKVNLASAETQIGSTVTTEQIDANTTTNINSATRLLEIDTGGRVSFKLGEKLRLTIKHFGSGGAANAGTGYGVDPQDRDDDSIPGGVTQIINDTETTQLKVAIPFVIDL